MVKCCCESKKPNDRKAEAKNNILQQGPLHGYAGPHKCTSIVWLISCVTDPRFVFFVLKHSNVFFCLIYQRNLLFKFTSKLIHIAHFHQKHLFSLTRLKSHRQIYSRLLSFWAHREAWFHEAVIKRREKGLQIWDLSRHPAALFCTQVALGRYGLCPDCALLSPKAVASCNEQNWLTPFLTKYSYFSLSAAPTWRNSRVQHAKSIFQFRNPYEQGVDDFRQGTGSNLAVSVDKLLPVHAYVYLARVLCMMNQSWRSEVLRLHRASQEVAFISAFFSADIESCFGLKSNKSVTYSNNFSGTKL